MALFARREREQPHRIIDADLIETLDYIEEDSLLHDDSWKWDTRQEEEAQHVTELLRIADNFDKRELMTICSLTVRKYPLTYLQVLAEYIISKGER